MKIYNKLIRDKIPEKIKADNCVPITRILSDEDYLNELNKKLQEELNEYLETGDIEELADLQEVMIGILDVKKVSLEEFEKVRMDKCLKRGAFKEKIFLEGIEENR